MEKTLIRMGVGKGKLLDITNIYLEQLGLEKIDKNSRVLTHYREGDKYKLKITLLRWEDIKAYANNFEMIIFGSDQWLETSKKSMIALKHFEQKNCRLSLLVPEKLKDEPLRYFLNKKVATGYPELAKSYMGISEDKIVKMTGSVEASIELGWADSIFDIVESGQTAKDNGLVEYKEFVKFGAVLATCKPEKIPMLQELGLIRGGETSRKIIAFDGLDGSGKSTLAKHFVQEGLGDENPIVLMCPYSGYIGVTAQSFLDAGKDMDWAYMIGVNHWRPIDGVNMVYDRNVLTCLTELIKNKRSEEEIRNILNSWMPLPDILFYCKSDIDIIEKRMSNRKNKDKYDNMLIEYEKLYDIAVSMLIKYTDTTVYLLNTDMDIKDTINEVNRLLSKHEKEVI